MADKVKLRLTVTVDYEADPEHYGTSDPTEMAAIDQASAEDGELLLFLESYPAIVTVEFADYANCRTHRTPMSDEDREYAENVAYSQPRRG